jgi:hypothetical protein
MAELPAILHITRQKTTGPPGSFFGVLSPVGQTAHCWLIREKEEKIRQIKDNLTDFRGCKEHFLPFLFCNNPREYPGRKETRKGMGGGSGNKEGKGPSLFPLTGPQVYLLGLFSILE